MSNPYTKALAQLVYFLIQQEKVTPLQVYFFFLLGFDFSLPLNDDDRTFCHLYAKKQNLTVLQALFNLESFLFRFSLTQAAFLPLFWLCLRPYVVAPLFLGLLNLSFWAVREYAFLQSLQKGSFSQIFDKYGLTPAYYVLDARGKKNLCFDIFQKVGLRADSVLKRKDGIFLTLADYTSLSPLPSKKLPNKLNLNQQWKENYLFHERSLRSDLEENLKSTTVISHEEVKDVLSEHKLSCLRGEKPFYRLDNLKKWLKMKQQSPWTREPRTPSDIITFSRDEEVHLNQVLKESTSFLP